MRALAHCGVASAMLFTCLPASAQKISVEDLTREITVAEAAQPALTLPQARVLNRSEKTDEAVAPAAPAPSSQPPAAAPTKEAPAAGSPASQTTAATPAPTEGPEKTIGKTVAPAPKPQPSVVISVNLTDQRMTVSEGRSVKYTWPISSGRSGYYTPTGTYRPQWMAKTWYSRKYDNAPMPNAIFFTGGFAIHATYSTGMLGRPASHGCVRLAPSNAATLYRMVQHHGMDRTKIVLHGSPKRSAPEVAERESRHGSRTASMSGYRQGYVPPGYRYAQPQSPFDKLFGGDEPQRRVVYVQPQQRYREASRPVYGYTPDGRLVRIR